MYIKMYLLFLLAAFSFACQSPQDNSCATDFNQLDLLENIGKNIIIPSYTRLSDASTTLETKTNLFLANPSTNSLDSLRNQFQKTWLAWQAAAIFEFGPAANEELRSYCNNFPANIVRIQEGINTGTYNLSTPAYSYARGFPALDYLLYGENKTAAEIVNSFTTGSQASNRQQYLKNVALLIKQKTLTVHNSWRAEGANYLHTFTTTKGVANGKPLSDLINQWNKNAELIKNERLGNPISAKTSYMPLLPDNVEAYYSKQSLNLVIRAVEVQKAVFLGSTIFGSTVKNGVGLDDYLESAGAKKGNKSLAVLIEEQYDATLVALRALIPSNSLHNAINTNLDGVKAAYAAAQNQVVATKTDLPAALCVSITYIDRVDDGD